MIYKTEQKGDEVYEIIYSETGSEYRKRRLEFKIGSILNELLEFNFEKFNLYINSYLDTIDDRCHPDFSNYNSFNNLSDDAKFLILFTSDIRFLHLSPRNKHRNRNRNYFQSVIKTVHFIKETVLSSLDTESYFKFHFKYFLNLSVSDSLYESKHDLNILNYVFPVAYAYINSLASEKKKPIELESLLIKAESNRDYISQIIDIVPAGNLYYEIMQKIKNIYQIDEKGYYRSIPIPFKELIKNFEATPLLQNLFLKAIYEYNTLQNDRSFAFKTLDEFIALSVLECYKNGYPIVKCSECNKLFVRLSNSRKLCGNENCISNNKRKSASHRKQQLGGIDDHNILSAIYKALCYSKINCDNPKFNLSAYVNPADDIDEALSKKIVEFLKYEIYAQCRRDNGLYKKKLSTMTEDEKSQSLPVYLEWLQCLKFTYSHQYVVNAYKNSFLYSFQCETPFEIEFFYINDEFSKIITTKKEVKL